MEKIWNKVLASKIVFEFGRSKSTKSNVNTGQRGDRSKLAQDIAVMHFKMAEKMIKQTVPVIEYIAFSSLELVGERLKLK